MHNKDNGGPAFPLAFEDDIQTKETFVQYGMALRDYFAAKVMAAMLSSGRVNLDRVRKPEIASEAYKYADAMLEARK